MLLFVGHLAEDGLTHQSIKVYLSAVRNLHVSAGLHDHFSRQMTPRVEQVLKGIKKANSKTATNRIRLPITLDIMQKIRSVLDQEPTNYTNILLWAACCLAFFGFLRCGEFTMPSKTVYDPETHLAVADVALDDKENPSVIQVTIKQSKTDPFRQGVHLYLGRTGNLVCPVNAILAYLAVRDSSPGPLFKLTDGSFLTRQQFALLISNTLKLAGIDDKHYNTHSFRIGAATSAKEAGISDVQIKMLGRWKSEAYQLYVRTPREQLAKLSKQLATVK